MRGRARVVALIPAHDEAEQIGGTIASLRAQTFPVERIVVMADNCSDATAQVAASSGADVYETSDKRRKTAGALDQGIRVIAADWRHWDYLLHVDADTVLAPDFVWYAIGELEQDDRLAGVWARSLTRSCEGFLSRLPLRRRRFDGHPARSPHGVHCLSGWASLARFSVLAQSPRTDSILAEDGPLRRDLLERGWRVKRADNPVVWGETRTTLGGFWNQRFQWARTLAW